MKAKIAIDEIWPYYDLVEDDRGIFDFTIEIDEEFYQRIKKVQKEFWEINNILHQKAGHVT